MGAKKWWKREWWGAVDRCWRDGEPEIPDRDRLMEHHLIPISEGGPDEPWNKGLLHVSCHDVVTRKMNAVRYHKSIGGHLLGRVQDFRCPKCRKLGRPIGVHEYNDTLYVDLDFHGSEGCPADSQLEKEG